MKRLIIIALILLFTGCATSKPTVSDKIKQDPVGTIGFGIWDAFEIGDGILW